MDDHLRILERNMALAARAARTDAAGWRHEAIARRPVRSRLAAALVALAAHLDATVARAQRQDAALSPANPA